MSKTHTITVAGRTLPVIEKALAADLGFQPLTTPILVHDDEEEKIIRSIAASLAAGGPRILWAVTLTDHGSRAAVVFWRTGMLTCREIEQELCLNSYAPRVIPEHTAAA